MEVTKEYLEKLQMSLRDTGYQSYADLLDAYKDSAASGETFRIGIAGDRLVGKSTLINTFAGRDILPVGFMPTDCKINIGYGEEDAVLFGDAGRENLSKLSDVCKEYDSLRLEVNQLALLVYHLELTEFPGNLVGSKHTDILPMTELYQCDAVIMVMSAEDLFSEADRIFLENYIKYVGGATLLLVVNKLSMAGPDEMDHVLQHIQNQMDTKYTDVKWALMEEDIVREKGVENAGAGYIKDIMFWWMEERETTQRQAGNLLSHICTLLEKDLEKMAVEKAQDDNGFAGKKQAVSDMIQMIRNCK